ncbi:MAG TPA: O-antigen ligase family protein [Candidatus Rubrimentiphilum sp.]|nr:O-antigen ligase family protein [Candidatus Rubrimentiphilum sp.]
MAVAFAFDAMAHRGIIHSAGVRGRHSEARHVPIHPIVYQPEPYAFPDALYVIAYVVFFAGSALVTMRRPIWGAALLVLIQPFALYGNVIHTTITLPKVGLVGVLLGLATFPHALSLASGKAFRSILLAGALVLTATMLTTVAAVHHGPVLRESLKMAEYLLLFIAIRVAYALDPDMRIVRAACIAVAIVVSALALSQEILGAPSGLWINGHQTPRIAGPLEGPNQLAGYFDIMIPLLLALVIVTPDIFSSAALVLTVFADSLTFSRAGLLAASAGILIVLYVLRSKPMKHAIACIAAGGIMGVSVVLGWAYVVHSTEIFRITGGLRGTTEVSYAGGVGTRSQLWHAALTLWKRHPLLGVGAGNFELEIPLTGIRGVRTHANSLYLQSLVEGGIPLFAATLWLTYVSIATFARDRLRSPFVLAAFAGSIAIALHQIVDLLVFYPKVGGWWWIVLALGAAQLAGTQPAREPAREPACV